MSTILSILPFLILLAFAVIGLIEYGKAVGQAIATKSITPALILSPIFSTVIGVVGSPIVFGAEIVGTIACIFYASALSAIILAFVQLFYDLIIKTIKIGIQGVATLIEGKIAGAIPASPPSIDVNKSASQ